MEGLVRRIARFDDPETPYLAWAAPQFISQHAGDYDHLSRLYEWHVMGEGAEEGGGMTGMQPFSPPLRSGGGGSLKRCAPHVCARSRPPRHPAGGPLPPLRRGRD